MFDAPFRIAALGLCLAAAASTGPALSSVQVPPGIKPGCEYKPIDDKIYGRADFKAPDVVESDKGVLRYTLRIAYGDYEIAGCKVHLRTYNGKLVGDTLKVKPGDKLLITLVNDIEPVKGSKGHDMSGMKMEGGMDLNVTNLHTHGLHVSPSGISDNVFRELRPGEKPLGYEIDIPRDHPGGTHWYHAHVHGSTAAQVSSGMAGQILVAGGLDDVKGIKGIAEKVMVLQQISYDQQGEIEDFSAIFGPNKWANSKRRVTINGQLVPVIHMRPGEIQRWRFVHGGVRENISLALQGSTLNEIAADGISLGRSVGWTVSKPLVISPGYREDVLVQARQIPRGQKKLEYYLVDGKLLATNTLEGELQAAIEAAQPSNKRRSLTSLLSALPPKPESVIAQVVVEGDPVDMAMPTATALAPTLPFADIMPDELKDTPQKVEFNIKARRCDSNGHCTEDCVLGTPDCAFRFMVNDYYYGPNGPTRVLKLGSASEWTLDAVVAAHPFHIHVNPFQLDRIEPDGKIHRIWKDVLLVDHDAGAIKIWSRYEDFDGDMVLHCHILDHEDEGMMQRVSIRR
jgi:FtsP/CotA-like multicopper oxidase with cupredoxin domain